MHERIDVTSVAVILMALVALITLWALSGATHALP